MKTAGSIFIDTSPENLIRNANHYVSWQNVCHVSIHLNAQWKQQHGDLATVIVQVALIQTEKQKFIYLEDPSRSLLAYVDLSSLSLPSIALNL